MKHLNQYIIESLLDDENHIVNRNDIIIPDNDNLQKIAITNMAEILWYLTDKLIIEYYGEHTNGPIRKGYTLNPFKVIERKSKKDIILQFDTNNYILSDNKIAYKKLINNSMDNEDIIKFREENKQKFSDDIYKILRSKDEYKYLYIIDENNNFYSCAAIRDLPNILTHYAQDILPRGKYLYLDIKRI